MSVGASVNKALQIDRLLETCVARGADEIHLAIGMPPLLRLDGERRELDVEVLDTEATAAPVRALTPEEVLGRCDEHGRAEFEFDYGTRARFVASVFNRNGVYALALRPLRASAVRA